MRPSVGDIVPQEWKERYGKGSCPVCAKPKSEWSNKYQRIYCSPECNSKYNENVFVWVTRREQIIKRDNYTCKACGKGNLAWVEWDERRWAWSNVDVHNLVYFYSRETGDEQPIQIKLEVDHIKAYVNGGDMWAGENLQTLCHACHVWKTKNDLKTRSRSKKLGHQKTITQLLVETT